jgi:HD-like signal output (HDOD) protein
MTHVFSQFNCNSIPEFKPDDLWKHSVASAGLAKRIAVLEQADEKTCDDSFIAGLLHDVGKLVLASKLNSEYRKVFEIASRDGTDLLDAERKTLGATHAEVGAYLLGLWGLSDSVVEAVAYHHSPEKCLSKQFSTLTAVHAANAISRHVSAAGDSPGLPGLSTEYIERIGKADRLQAWIESYVREHSEA